MGDFVGVGIGVTRYCLFEFWDNSISLFDLELLLWDLLVLLECIEGIFWFYRDDWLIGVILTYWTVDVVELVKDNLFKSERTTIRIKSIPTAIKIKYFCFIDTYSGLTISLTLYIMTVWPVSLILLKILNQIQVPLPSQMIRDLRRTNNHLQLIHKSV